MLSAAQFSALHTLREFGAKSATEVVLPPAIDGSRKVKLEWSVATGPTLAKLEAAGYVRVTRKPVATIRDAVGRKGRERRALTIEITDAGRNALAIESA